MQDGMQIDARPTVVGSLASTLVVEKPPLSSHLRRQNKSKYLERKRSVNENVGTLCSRMTVEYSCRNVMATYQTKQESHNVYGELQSSRSDFTGLSAREVQIVSPVWREIIVPITALLGNAPLQKGCCCEP